MAGWRDTLPAPELPAGRRSALVVATSRYGDPALRQLRAPAQDATALADVLGNPEIGGFEVTTVTDGTAHQVRLAVEDFLADRATSDLLVVYLSCHGLVDARRKLYLAATDTVKSRLAATGVEAQWLLEQLEDCRARRQVVILDCCFSGAFAHGSKGNDDLGLERRFHAQGSGRVVLTASRATEYSFEGDSVTGSVTGSVFTGALVDGMRSGAADTDRDGYVSVDEAYTYAFDQVRVAAASQTPQRWLYGAEGQILLARSPTGIMVTPASLPEGIRTSLDSNFPAIRLGAVKTLGEWLTDPDPARVLAARQALHEVADHDNPRVATAARTLLDAHAPTSRPVPATGPRPEPAPKAPSPPQARPPKPPPSPPAPRSSRTGPATRVRTALPRVRPALPRVRITIAAAVILLAGTITVARWPSSPHSGYLPLVLIRGGTFIRILPGNAPVYAVAFSPDGKTLATGSGNKTVRLWNPTTGKLIGSPLTGHTDPIFGPPLTGHTDSVNAVAFSPDGKTLATGCGDGTVRLWNPITRQPIGSPLTGHTDSVNAVAFSPGGKTLATGSYDHTVRLWNPTTGKPIGQPLQGHTGTVYTVTFSPDGKTLATGSSDHTVRLWNPTTGKPIGQPLQGHAATVYTVAFSPDDKTLATGSRDHTVRLWNPTTGQPVGQPLQGHAATVYTVAFSPDGKTLATGSRDHTVRLWKIT
ncbi:MAG TPA: caspase family protein [Mycobacteriales bacterium]|nr:caspase family protein [Mycobacteriales bacterium]